MRRSALMLACATVVGACQSGPNGVNVRPHHSAFSAELGRGVRDYDAGQRYLRARNFGHAIEAFRRDLKARGANPATLHGLAAAYKGLGRSDIADRYLAQARQEITGSTFASAGPDAARERVLQTPTPVRAATGLGPADLTAQRPRVPARRPVARAPETPRLREAAAPVFSQVNISGDRSWTLEAPKPEPIPARMAQPLYPQDAPVPVSYGTPPADYIAEPQPEPVQPPAVEAKAPVQPAPRAVIAEPANDVIAISARQPTPGRVTATAQATPHATLQALAPWVRQIAPNVTAETSVRVVNGNGVAGMAGRFSKYLGAQGVDVNQLANAAHYRHRQTVIAYRPGQLAQALVLAALTPVPVTLSEDADARADVVITLGSDVLDPGVEQYAI